MEELLARSVDVAVTLKLIGRKELTRVIVDSTVQEKAIAAGETNWHAYACDLIERARAAGKAIRLAPDATKAINTSDYPTPAKRSSNSRLDTSLLCETFGLHLPDGKIGFDHILDQIL